MVLIFKPTKKTSTQAGYSMVEVLIAITILLLAVAGPLTIAHKGLQSAFFSRDQVTAYMLAQEGIEIFMALRNEEALKAIDAGDLDMTWSWVETYRGDGVLHDFHNCFVHGVSDPDPGCNVDVDRVGVGDDLLTDLLAVVEPCDPIENCVMDYVGFGDPGTTRARYSLQGSNGGSVPDSKFTRVIKINNVFGSDIRVTSEVSWDPILFGSTQSVTLSTYIFDLYGEFNAGGGGAGGGGEGDSGGGGGIFDLLDLGG